MSFSMHPLYATMKRQWELCHDSYLGQEAVKDKTVKYLPFCASHIEDGADTNTQSLGYKNYLRYLQRAVYPDNFKTAVERNVGVMHKEKPIIKLPEEMLKYTDSITLMGEDIPMLLRRINTEQLKSGRLGILGDIVVNKDGIPVPIIHIYKDTSIVNWDDTNVDKDSIDLRFVALDESCYVREPDSFKWVQKEQYRILALVDPVTKKLSNTNSTSKAVFGTCVVENENDAFDMEFAIPMVRGQTLSEIPFYFINSKDLSPSPDTPPLLELANICMSIYKLQADYRQSLHMQGQDTLVITGTLDDKDNIRTGAGACINVSTGNTAQYIGVSASGISEQRTCIENDMRTANSYAVQLNDSTGANQSGDALKIRVAAQTATLPQIAQTACSALTGIFRMFCDWFNVLYEPEDIEFIPNLEFSGTESNVDMLIKLQEFKLKGGPISEESIHALLSKEKLTEYTLEEEKQKIESEGVIL